MQDGRSWRCGAAGTILTAWTDVSAIFGRGEPAYLAWLPFLATLERPTGRKAVNTNEIPTAIKYGL
jgi:hypothetical protein